MDEDAPRWEHFPHGADVGIRGIGRTVEAAFAQAALALTAVVADPMRVRPRRTHEVECQADSLEDLLFDFLDALVFSMSAQGMLFSVAEVHIEGTHLRARLLGEPVDPARHQPAIEVKGPTFTELRVTHEPERDRWCAQCVVDV